MKQWNEKEEGVVSILKQKCGKKINASHFSARYKIDRNYPFSQAFNLVFIALIFFIGMYPLKGVADNFRNLLKAEEIHVPSNKIGFLSVTCSANGEYYGGANESRRIVIRKIKDGSVVKEVKSEHVGIQSLEFDPSSENIAVGYFGGIIRVQSLSNEDKEKYVDLPLRGVADIEYSPDGKYLAVAGYTKVIVLDARNLKEIYTVSDMSAHKVISINRDSAMLAVGKSRGVTLLNLKDGSEIKRLGNSDVFSMDFSSEGSVLAFDYVRYGVIWDLDENEIDYSIVDPGLMRMAINADGSIMMIGRTDGVVRQINLQTKTEINHIAAPGGSILSMKRCGEKYLITGHSYDIMNLIDLSKGRVMRTHVMKDSDYLKKEALYRQRRLNRTK